MISARGILTVLFSAFPLAAFAQEFGALVPDSPAKAGNVEAVCTGIGLDARQNPAWASYPLKIEVAGKGGQYLGDVRLILSQKDRTVATLTCGGPWVLLRLPAGRYQLEAQTEGRTASSAAFVPAAGQGRIILRFPELGGEISPPASLDGTSAGPPSVQ